MAFMIFTAKDLAADLKRLEPVVFKEAERIAKALEKHYAAKDKAMADLNARYDLPAEEFRDLAEKRVEKYNETRKFWQADMTIEEAEQDIRIEYLHEMRMARCDLIHDFAYRDTPTDELSGTHSYLLALCERLDPEAQLALSDNETFRFNRMLELEDAASTD